MPNLNDKVSRPQNIESGLTRVKEGFRLALLERSAALMPYFTLGYPDPDTCGRIIKAIAPYSDLLELGMPFSDPIADGPTIQRTTQHVLNQGFSTTNCLELLFDLRKQGVTVPVLLMGYYNPILAYGEDRFAVHAKKVGADGLIIPDLPPEESAAMAKACAENELALVRFLAPTSNPNRRQSVIRSATGFIYVVTVTGVTGARSDLPRQLPSFVKRVKRLAKTPVAVGFGISTPAQAASVAKFADGVIVGSALIDAVDQAEDKIDGARSFVQTLYEALPKE